MGNLTIWDLLLTPFYLLILISLAKRHRDKRYPVGHPLRVYYLKGLYAKFIGAIFIALIYEYYYPGGDTFNFLYHSKIINSALSESFSVWTKLLFHAPVGDDPKLYGYYSQMFWVEDLPSYRVSSIAALFGLLNGTSYIPIALLFAYLAYTGIWAMYKTFVDIYPTLHKELAIAFLFIPSTIVWGSAIFKDTICMFSLGWMTYATFQVFVNKKVTLKNLAIIGLTFLLISGIKMYILMAFIPALSFWLLTTFSKRIKATGARWLVNIIFIGGILGGFVFFAGKFAKELNKYSLSQIIKTAQVTRDWTSQQAGDEGSAYDLGSFDGTAAGMASKFPQAVVVTLFRPFPWEVKKVIVALSALESLFFVYFTLKVFLYRRGRPFYHLVKDPNILFCFVFALIFAFAVGISSGNFGALSRYKIPCLPFYATVLMILLSKQKEARALLNQRQTQKLSYEPAI